MHTQLQPNDPGFSTSSSKWNVNVSIKGASGVSGELGTQKDELTTAQHAGTAILAAIKKMMNLPQIVRLESMGKIPETFLANLWFGVNQLVAYTNVMSEVMQMQIKQAFTQAEFAVTTIALMFSVAQSLATMTLQAAQADANQEIMQAASSFMQAAVTLTTFAVQWTATRGAAGKEYKEREANLDKKANFADKEYETADTNALTHQKIFEDGEFSGAKYKDLIKTDPDNPDKQIYTKYDPAKRIQT